MPFENGSFALTVFHIYEKLPENILDKFAAKAAGKLDDIKEELSVGWVSGRHLLEREIDESTAVCGGLIHIALRLAQRKVPRALLQAECRKEELEYMLANKQSYVPSKMRKEIRKSIQEKRLPQMPPTLKAIPFVLDTNSRNLYLATTSQKAVEMFTQVFFETLKIEPRQFDVAELMYGAHKQKPDALPSVKFAEGAKETEESTPGRDFLTWLWFFSENSGGKITHPQYGDFELIVEGPLTLAFGEEEAEGAAETVVRKGNPVRSAEAKAGLAVGKKLRKARLLLSRGKDVWKTSFDADLFAFSGFSLPENEEMDAQSAFAERINSLQIFLDVFRGLFKDFSSAAMQRPKWKSVEKEIFSWSADRDSL